MIIGMDFGTTNSGLAFYDGQALHPIPLDPASPHRVVDRTALYVTHAHTIATGRQAIERYLAHNVGRPVKMERVRVGTIAVTAAEIGTYYRDVHILSDTLAPGRLFTSFKTFLASPHYEGTVVGGLSYALDDIVAAYLQVAKMRAERVLGREARAIVLGRPVRFSTDPAADALARDRLVGAARRAGFTTVYLQYEPVAAALQYERSLRREQRVLIFDFGGGTLDVTIMRLGNPATRAVLATAGLPIAGDVFDQRIVRRKLARAFGEGSTYVSAHRRLPAPAWIYDALSDWQTIVTLQEPENRAVLEDIRASSDQPERIAHLIELAAQNYGLPLYTAVEEAKRRLSLESQTEVQFAAQSFAVRESLGRAEFEVLIEPEVQQVELLLRTIVADAGLTPEQIDAVVRTGGSAQIPVFVALLQRLFGTEKVRSLDAFSSVTAGLAVAAHHIEKGEIAASAEASAPASTVPRGAAVAAVDAGFLSTWVKAQEQAGTAPAARAAVTWVTADYQLHAWAFPTTASQPALAHGLRDLAGSSAKQALLTELDARLVVLTSAYRCVLTTPRQLLVLAEAGLSLAHLYGFDPREVICAIGAWEHIRTRERLAIIGARGLLYVVDMERARSRLDRSIPFSLQTPSTTDPVALAGVDPGQGLALVTSRGRALRRSVQGVPSQGVQAIKRDTEDRIIALLAVQEGEYLLLLGGDGKGWVAPADQVPLIAAPNTRAPLVAPRVRALTAAVLDPGAAVWLLTSRYVRPLPAEALAIAPAAATALGRVVALEAGEQVVAALTTPEGTPTGA